MELNQEQQDDINHNNNNNVNDAKLVLTIKVNDEFVNENDQILLATPQSYSHVNGSTAIHITVPPENISNCTNGNNNNINGVVSVSSTSTAGQVLEHSTSSSISSIPINIPDEKICTKNGGIHEDHVVTDEENDDDDDENDVGEEFDFSSSDFEDAQEELVSSPDRIIRNQKPAENTLSIIEGHDAELLLSPGPLQKDKSLHNISDLIDIETEDTEQPTPVSLSHHKSSESDLRSEDDVLMSQFFGKANEIVGF